MIVIISTGDPAANRQLFSEHKIDAPVLLQKETEVAAVYKAHGTPGGYLISSEGKIASGFAIGAEALLEIANEPRSNRSGEVQIKKSQILNSESQNDAVQSPASKDGNGRFSNRSLAGSKIKRDGLKAGTRAPDFRLPRLDGCGELSLGELPGHRVLLVFSSPACGPCSILAPKVEKFRREHPELEVVMISKREPHENRAKVKEFGLTFPIVLQQQWEISRRYAMFATPVAYLIDERGTILHDVAVGVEAIEELCNRAAALEQPVLV